MSDDDITVMAATGIIRPLSTSVQMMNQDGELVMTSDIEFRPCSMIRRQLNGAWTCLALVGGTALHQIEVHPPTKEEIDLYKVREIEMSAQQQLFKDQDSHVLTEKQVLLLRKISRNKRTKIHGLPGATLERLEFIAGPIGDRHLTSAGRYNLYRHIREYSLSGTQAEALRRRINGNTNRVKYEPTTSLNKRGYLDSNDRVTQKGRVALRRYDREKMK